MQTHRLGPLISDIEGVELSQLDKEVLRHPKLGGLILFSRNFESVLQLRDLVRCIREVRSELVVCVDQEGGRVQRFKDGFTRLPAMGKVIDLAKESDLYQGKSVQEASHALAADLGFLMASELTDLDVDHSFAPVLDLDINRSQVIGDRSFSDSPEGTADLAGAFIDGMSNAGMAATAKHFPGHGGVLEDSHLELPQDERTLEEIQERDLIPFSQLKDRYAALMTAHIVFSQVDQVPVSFSSVWLKGVLRESIGFDGLVLSDDLSMKGAAESGDYKERSRLAIEAGCDAILICNQRREAECVLEYLEAEGFGEHEKLNVLRRSKVTETKELRKRKQSVIDMLEQFS